MSPRGRKILLLQLVLWPLMAVGAEVSFRVLQSARGKGYDAEDVSRRARERASAMTDAVPQAGDGAQLADESVPTVLHPYSGYAPRTDSEAIARHLRISSAPESAKRFDVLVLGGSVAGNFGRHGFDALTRRLIESEGFEYPRAHLYNYGRGGYKQPQHATMLTYLLSIGLEPDAVIVLDGFNEVALAAYNHHVGSFPLFPSFPHWAAASHRADDDPRASALRERIEGAQARVLAVVSRADDLGLWRSALAGSWTWSRVDAAYREYAGATAELQDYLAGDGAWPEMKGPPYGGSREEAVRLAVETWQRSSLDAAAVCAARGIAYLHVLQPTLHDEGAKPVTDEERDTGYAHEAWIDGVRIGYPLLREAGAELARDGVAFVDASGAFAEVDRTLYYDACHFRAPGHHLLADLMAPRLLQLLQ